MQGFYKLGDKDRERFNCPEWLPLDLLDASIADITELGDRFGFELADWPDPFYGMENVEGERKRPFWQFQVGVWLALHAAGIDAPFDEVGRAALLRIRFRPPEPEVESGKDQGGTPTSTPPDESEPSTTPPSSTSSPD